MSAKILIPLAFGPVRIEQILRIAETYGTGLGEIRRKHWTLEGRPDHDTIQTTHAREALARAYPTEPHEPPPPLAAA